MIRINVEQRSEAWHQARLGRITASSFADLMAKKETAAYQNLIAEVVGEILTGETEESYQSPAMERGIELEPEARLYYENTFELVVDQTGFIIPDEDDEFHDWIGISPDGIIGNGILEIKCPLIKTHLNYIEKGVLPSEYKWQVQGQLMVSEKEFCDFMSYYPKLKSFIIRVYSDIAMHEQLRTELRTAIVAIKAKIEAYKKYDSL